MLSKIQDAQCCTIDHQCRLTTRTDDFGWLIMGGHMHLHKLGLGALVHHIHTVTSTHCNSEPPQTQKFACLSKLSWPAYNLPAYPEARLSWYGETHGGARRESSGGGIADVAH